jgi:dienelactone hydrolase
MLKMRTRFLFLLSFACVLGSCTAKVTTPIAEGPAAPEAIALSLSTVDPEESLSLFEYDREMPLDIREENRWHENNATWIDFTYASPHGGRVPARLVIPDGIGPFPGILLQHGGPGTLEDMVDFARTFANYGAATISITNPYRRPGGWEITQYMGNTWPMFTERDLEIKIQLVVDSRRAIDILEAQPEIDPERLAYFGVSFGGSMGGLVAGVEDRLKAYVFVVGDGGLVEHTSDPDKNGLPFHFSQEWAELMWPTEPLHFIGRAAPAALLFQNGLYDIHVPPHDALRFYSAASEPKTMIWYEGGHSLPWQFVKDAADWLQSYLGDRLFLLGPNYRPSAIVLDRGILAVAVLSAAVFLYDTFRNKPLSWSLRLVWLLGMILLGPIGFLLYWLTTRHRIDAPPPTTPNWRQVLEFSTVITITLYIAFFLGEKTRALLPTTDFRVRLLQLYLAMLILSWPLTLLTRKQLSTTISTHLLNVNLFWSVITAYPTLLMPVLENAEWSKIPIDISLAVLFSFPLHAWLLRRGLEHWRPLEVQEIVKKPPQTPTLVGLILASYLLIVGSVVVIIKIYTGLPWRDVIMLLAGTYS